MDALTYPGFQLDRDGVGLHRFPTLSTWLQGKKCKRLCERSHKPDENTAYRPYVVTAGLEKPAVSQCLIIEFSAFLMQEI